MNHPDDPAQAGIRALLQIAVGNPSRIGEIAKTIADAVESETPEVEEADGRHYVVLVGLQQGLDAIMMVNSGKRNRSRFLAAEKALRAGLEAQEKALRSALEAEMAGNNGD